MELATLDGPGDGFASICLEHKKSTSTRTVGTGALCAPCCCRARHCPLNTLPVPPVSPLCCSREPHPSLPSGVIHHHTTVGRPDSRRRNIKRHRPLTKLSRRATLLSQSINRTCDLSSPRCFNRPPFVPDSELISKSEPSFKRPKKKKNVPLFGADSHQPRLWQTPPPLASFPIRQRSPIDGS